MSTHEMDSVRRMAQKATGVIPPRVWQVAALEKIRALRREGADRALIAACPGAGKTRVAAELINQDFEARVCDVAVIVVLSRYLKRQWRRALREWIRRDSIENIDNGTLEDRKARGMVLYDPERPVLLVTYAQVASFPDLFATLSARHRVFVVIDEVHHADDEADFGQALMTGFTDAVFKLSLSGTPFTTKGANLVFCQSHREFDPEENAVVNVTTADITYSYGQATRAKGTSDDPDVVRTVEFIKWNGFASWQITNTRTGEVTERRFDGSRKTDPLGPLIDPTNESMVKMLRAGLAELEDIRQHHRTAGLLITARDVQHVDDIVEVLTKPLPEGLGIDKGDIEKIVHDTPSAQDRIEAFAKSRQRILVTVKMISEGVDIKRLRVGIYGSNVLTRMFFIQFIGRFIRWDPALGAGQFARVLIPEHVILIKYAREIEDMIAKAALPLEGPPPPGGDNTGDTLVTGRSGDGHENGLIQHGADYEAAERADVMGWAKTANADRIDFDTLVRLYRTHRAGGGSPSSPPSGDNEPDLGKQNDKLVAQIIAIGKARGKNIKFDYLQAWANRQVNIPKKDKLTPPSVLQARLDHLRRLVVMVFDDRVPNDLL